MDIIIIVPQVITPSDILKTTLKANGGGKSRITFKNITEGKKGNKKILEHAGQIESIK